MDYLSLCMLPDLSSFVIMLYPLGCAVVVVVVVRAAGALGAGASRAQGKS